MPKKLGDRTAIVYMSEDSINKVLYDKNDKLQVKPEMKMVSGQFFFLLANNKKELNELRNLLVHGGEEKKFDLHIEGLSEKFNQHNINNDVPIVTAMISKVNLDQLEKLGLEMVEVKSMKEAKQALTNELRIRMGLKRNQTDIQLK